MRTAFSTLESLLNLKSVNKKRSYSIMTCSRDHDCARTSRALVKLSVVSIKAAGRLLSDEIS